jgi:hypothetical protein
MTGLDYIIEAELMGPLATQWLAGLSAAMRMALGRWAVNQLDLDTGRVKESWLGLDDPGLRSVAIASDPQLGRETGEAIVPDATAPTYAQLQAAAERSGMTQQQNPGRLRSGIAEMLPRWLTRPEVLHRLVDAPFAHGWGFVANEIGRRVYANYTAWRAAGAAEEWRLLNHLLLAEYFRQCRHQTAAQVLHELEDFRSGAMSVRGTLVNTSGWVSPHEVSEGTIRISGFYGGTRSLAHGDRSDLAACVHRESVSSAAGTGVIQRIAGMHTQDVPEDVRTGRVETLAWLRARGYAYLRFERSILAYMALATIEQLVRGLAKNRGVPHTTAANGVPDLVDNPALQLPAQAVERVKDLFDAGRGNVRHRIMHGVFLLTSSKRLQDNLVAGGLASAEDPSTRDPHTPENIANLTLECLQYLDRVVHGIGPLSDADLDWGQASRLGVSDLAFCGSLALDMLPNAAQSNVEEIKGHLKFLSAYYRVVMPGLGQFVRMGYSGFIDHYSQKTLPLLHAMAIIFEASYRLTCHLVKLEIVNKPALPVPHQTTPIRIQYYMLDGAGLCRPDYYDRLVEHLPAAERGNGRTVLECAVMARNALSHGAIVRFDEATINSYNRVLMQAIRVLMQAGLHHMTQEGAWYRWQDLRRRDHGFDVPDWLEAEREITHWIITKGQPPRV